MSMIIWAESVICMALSLAIVAQFVSRQFVSRRSSLQAQRVVLRRAPRRQTQ